MIAHASARDLIVASIIGYRIARLVGRDDILQPLRDRMPYAVALGVTCAWCAGVWLGIVAAFILDGSGAQAFVDAALIATGIGVLDEAIERLHHG